jgi:hypothetical protein
MADHAVRLAEGSEPNSPQRVEAVVLMRPEPLVSQDAEAAPVSGGWKGSRSNREERILADLVQHPEQFAQAGEAIVTTTFTADARSDLFEALSRVHRRAEPVDNLTVAWELDRIQADGFRDAGIDPAAYVDRLAALPVEPGTAVETAQKIASEDQIVARRQARAKQSPGPTHGGYVADHSVGRRVDHDVTHRPKSIDPPSPDTKYRGPRPGH